ncbi:YbhB/YbcL family Raf kinase inhibitor-like protein [Pyrobaculum ferrireducens]|uniref:YbhB/YbcL family Raf kinase inhibitor-like protein n=1 Tax=Pyrobaculum ferrireducens TaxID=1104324 RepID=G7VFT8_9CREN|nr:YbhB/YbcL family Raf kinase inhibitor-like protein [Pyrobaculum ferrireducens]AET31745.1 hypothetical protein P186_0287 [Pyrobaculum ferrireducens]
MKRRVVLIGAALALLIAAAIYLAPRPATQPPLKIYIESPAFANGTRIPPQYTCDGADASPPLRWSGVPPGAKSLMIVVVDPDAPRGPFTHWVIYNIDPNTTELPPNLEKTPTTRYGHQAMNDFGKVGYGGPCPPPGPPHRYIFTIYALDTKLRTPPGSPHQDVIREATPHIIAAGQLVGLYRR